MSEDEWAHWLHHNADSDGSCISSTLRLQYWRRWGIRLGVFMQKKSLFLFPWLTALPFLFVLNLFLFAADNLAFALAPQYRGRVSRFLEYRFPALRIKYALPLSSSFFFVSSLCGSTQNLASTERVIVVEHNYRLGLLGFLGSSVSLVLFSACADVCGVAVPGPEPKNSAFHSTPRSSCAAKLR